MRAPRFGRPHSFPPWLSVLAIPLVLWPGLVHGSGDFAAPAPSMIAQLRRQQAAEDWLRVTMETNRLELGVASASELMATTSAETTATTPPPAEAWVTKVRSRIKPGELLRLTGDFGRFTGSAGDIGDQGLSGLRQDPAFKSTSPLPSEPLSWASITRVERRGKSTHRYAVMGGLALGTTFGLLAAAATSALAFSYATPGELAGSFAVGFLIGGGMGAGVGALIGSWVPQWHRIHP